MAKTRVDGDGPLSAEVLVCAERPGREEIAQGRGLVGTSGIEFFGGWRRAELPKGSKVWQDCYMTGRWERIVGIPRDEVRVENLVRTYSHEPPAEWEVRRDEGQLVNVLRKMRNLKVVVAIGAHAAKWFLRRDVPMSLVGGVPHTVCLGDVGVKSLDRITVVPCVHPAAALRNPEQNQERLSADLRAVRRVLDGELTAKTFKTQAPIKLCDYSLAKYAVSSYRIRTAFYDCEGVPDAPECITLCWNGRHTFCAYADDPKALGLVQQFFDKADAVGAHWEVYDRQVAEAMGLRVPDNAHCSMLMAFCLAEAQGVKDLAYRELGLDLPEYGELVGPVDDTRCREWLVKYEGEFGRRIGEHIRKQTRGLKKVTKKAIADAKRQIPDLIKLQRSLCTAIQNPEPGVRKRWKASAVLSTVQPPLQTTWKDLPGTVREPYAATDPWLAKQVADRFLPRITETGVDKVYETTRRILPMLARMESVGMAVDTVKLRRLSANLEMRFYRLVEQISTLVGRVVNPNTPADVSALLFDELGVSVTKLTKGKKHYTTDDKYLKARKQEHPVIPLLLQCRQLWKMKSTYCDGVLAAQRGSVLYPHLTYTRVVTGRLSAKDPNVLAIPKHTPDAPRFRACFVARRGHVLLSSDLSQIELRVAAHLSADPRLCREYRDGKDKHQETVDHVLKQPGSKDEATRRIAKNLNFAILMDTTEYGLYDQIREQGIETTHEQCRAWIDSWYETYHYVKAFGDRQKAFALKHGYVVAPLSGRRRYCGGVHSTVPYIRDQALREVQAFAYSTDAQYIMQCWMGEMWARTLRPRQGRAGQYCEPTIQVHDAQQIEVQEGSEEEIMEEIQGYLPQLLDVPTKTESKVGRNWKEVG